MKAILDTHTFIWMDSEPAKVSSTVRQYLADPSVTVFLSVVNVWEIIIKMGTRKLTIRDAIDVIVQDHLRQTPLHVLGIEYSHVLQLEGLPVIHKDPFDRILIAQALAENAVLLTDDPLIRQYSVLTAW